MELTASGLELRERRSARREAFDLADERRLGLLRVVWIARGDRGEEPGVAIRDQHGRDAIGETTPRAQLFVEPRPGSMGQHDLGEPERREIRVVDAAEPPAAGDVQQTRPALLMAPARSVQAPDRVGSRRFPGVELRMGSAAASTRSWSTGPTTASAAFVAHQRRAYLVEIVDGDRGERLRRAEDRIRERMLGPVQRLGQELPDAPALLCLVRELAQHDGPLAIEIGARRPRCRQTAERAQRRRHVRGHDDRVDATSARASWWRPPRHRAPRSRAARRLPRACGRSGARAGALRRARRPWRDPTPTVSRTATTGPGRSSAATRSPASVRLTTGTGQPGVVVRVSST